MAVKAEQLVHLRLPMKLVEKLDKVAEKEHRDRRAQIEIFLERAVKNE